MNETITQLFDRKSVRVFEDRIITEEEKTLILDAAIQAPTAGNLHLYSILEITDPAMKNKLADSCDHQPFIAKAPLVLIFVADACRLYDGFNLLECEVKSPGVGQLLLCISDALIAAQNAVVAAQSLGIGSCYIGTSLKMWKNTGNFWIYRSIPYRSGWWCSAIPCSSNSTARNRPGIGVNSSSTKTPIGGWMRTG